MKSLFIALLLFTWLFVSVNVFAQNQVITNTSTGFVLTGCIMRPLKITSYYTPEAIQWVFFKGDYSTDKKLNGGNVHGASGKETYNGMLAWPKQYPFGTTVSIPGVGIGVIHDRWWAIVSSWWVDRIDIWAWYGLQGMVNALSRGSKIITGEICSGWIIGWPIWFDRSRYPTWEAASKQMIWSIDMELGNNGLTVYYLNSFLQQLGYLKPVNSSAGRQPQQKLFWITNDQFSFFTTGTKLALCQFQQDVMWLSGTDQYCGFYGTQTKVKFKELVRKGTITISSPVGWQKTLVRKPVKRMLRIR